MTGKQSGWDIQCGEWQRIVPDEFVPQFGDVAPKAVLSRLAQHRIYVTILMAASINDGRFVITGGASLSARMSPTPCSPSARG